MQKRPFALLTLKTANGEQYEIAHPERVTVTMVAPEALAGKLPLSVTNPGRQTCGVSRAARGRSVVTCLMAYPPLPESGR